MRFLNLVFLLIVIVLFSSCNDNSTDVNINDPNSEELQKVFKKAEDIPYLRSLLVQKDFELVGEKYFNSNSFNKYDVRSVTKSFVSVLTGIAIEKGYIESIDQTLGDYFIGLEPAKAAITIKELLTMTSGFEGDEFVNMQYYIDWAYSSDPLEYALSRDLTSTPGTEFHYFSAVPYIMGRIIEIAYGNSLYVFADEFLFKKLNFENPQWETLSDGTFNGGAGLTITARDMIKFGQMIINGGSYNGIQIVSQEWVSESTKRHYYTGMPYKYEKEYGYYWWVLPNTSTKIFFANGYGGNFIFCVPEYNLVVTASSEWRSIPQATAGQNWFEVCSLIVEEILPIYIEE